MAVSDSKFHAQFLPLEFFFESMSMHDMVFLLCMAVVLCCVGWLVWRLQGFLRHMYNHSAREVRVAWRNTARARAAFRSNSGVASDFDNWVLLDSGASVTIISEAFLNKCCTVISRGKSDSPVSISTATSESLRVDEEVSCILRCHQQGGEILGVHLKGYVSEKVPLTLVSTGILGTGGWKIGNKGPLMTLNYSGTRLATHLYANCSWVYAIDSREDYAIETMKDLGISIPPNLGSSLVPVASSPRPGAQITEASVTTAKPVSNVTKATKPALKPEDSQAQATVSQCQCECEGCLIGNCPKEIKKLGLIPEVSPGCICKAVIYQTCFVPSTYAVKFHECFCNSLNMFQDGMCTCHDMFLCNLSRALSNLMLCLTCLACWLSRVVLVVLLEILEAWLGRVMFGLSCLVEKIEIRHLVLKPRLALLIVFFLVCKYGEASCAKRDKDNPATAPWAARFYRGGDRTCLVFCTARAESFAPFSRKALEKESQSQGKDKSQGKDQGKAKRKGQSKGRDQEEQGPKIQKGQEAFPARDRLCDDRGPGRGGPQSFPARARDRSGQGWVHFSGKGDGEADNGLCIRQESRSSGEGSGAKERSRSKEGVRGTCSGEAKGLQVWLGSQSASEGLASIRVPTQDTFEATLCHSSKGCSCISDERAGPPGACYATERVGGSSGSAESEEETWRKWQSPVVEPKEVMKPPPPPPAPAAPRIYPRSVTVEDLQRLRDFPNLRDLAEQALLYGPWTLNLGQQASLGLISPSTIEEARRAAASTTAAPRALPPPPPAPSSFRELLLDLPPPPAVPGTGTTPPALDLPTPPPVPKASAPTPALDLPTPPKVPPAVPKVSAPPAASAPIVAKPKLVPVKKMPVAAKAGEVVPIWSDSDRE